MIPAYNTMKKDNRHSEYYIYDISSAQLHFFMFFMADKKHQ
jgi:hypothetical protein